MPKSLKRKNSDPNEILSITKRLKLIEHELKCQRGSVSQRRRRPCVIESSSSSASTSRDSTPPLENQQDGYNSEAREVEDSVMVDQDTPLSDDTRPFPTEVVHGVLAETQELAIPTKEVLNDNLLEILGLDPSATVEYGPEVHKELATRLSHIAASGLPKDARKDLCEKYLVPSNCTHIGAPKLNAEIKAALNESLIKRDKAIEARQKPLASAISCLAHVITDQLANKETNHELLKKVMDASRLLCDIQYSESITRRNFASFSLRKEMKEHLFNTTIDTYLFGENLPDALKTAKAVSKSGTDLKVETKPPKKTRQITTSQKPSTTRNLNWRAPAPARRQQGPPRSRESASQRNQPGTSLKQSSYHQKPTRRR